MSKVIIYKNANGNVSICYPSPDLDVNEVARKDVPIGTDYWIVEDTDLPSDFEFFNAWELDIFALGNPTGTSIGTEAWQEEQKAIKEQKEKDAANDYNQSQQS